MDAYHIALNYLGNKYGWITRLTQSAEKKLWQSPNKKAYKEALNSLTDSDYIKTVNFRAIPEDKSDDHAMKLLIEQYQYSFLIKNELETLLMRMKII